MCPNLRWRDSSDLFLHLKLRHLNLGFAEEASSVSSPPVDPLASEKAMQLSAMGFPLEHCAFALEQCHDDVIAATNWLLNNAGSVGALVESRNLAEQEEKRRQAEETKQAQSSVANKLMKTLENCSKQAFQESNLICCVTGDIFNFSSIIESGFFSSMAFDSSFAKPVRRTSLIASSQDPEKAILAFARSEIELAVVLARISLALVLSKSEAQTSEQIERVDANKVFNFIKLTMFRGELFDSGSRFGSSTLINQLVVRIADFFCESSPEFRLRLCKDVIEQLNSLAASWEYDECPWFLRYWSLSDSEALKSSAFCFERIPSLLKLLVKYDLPKDSLDELIKSLVRSIKAPNTVFKSLSLILLSDYLGKYPALKANLSSLSIQEDITYLYSNVPGFSKSSQSSTVAESCLSLLYNLCDELMLSPSISPSLNQDEFNLKFDSKKCSLNLEVSSDGLTISHRGPQSWQTCCLAVPQDFPAKGDGLISFVVKLESLATDKIVFGFVDSNFDPMKEVEWLGGSTISPSWGFLPTAGSWHANRKLHGLQLRRKAPVVKGHDFQLVYSYRFNSLSLFHNGVITSFIQAPNSQFIPAITLYEKDDSIRIIAQSIQISSYDSPLFRSPSCFSDVKIKLDLLRRLGSTYPKFELCEDIAVQFHLWFNGKLVPRDTGKAVLFLNTIKCSNSHITLIEGQKYKTNGNSQSVTYAGRSGGRLFLEESDDLHRFREVSHIDYPLEVIGDLPAIEDEKQVSLETCLRLLDENIVWKESDDVSLLQLFQSLDSSESWFMNIKDCSSVLSNLSRDLSSIPRDNILARYFLLCSLNLALAHVLEAASWHSLVSFMGFSSSLNKLQAITFPEVQKRPWNIQLREQREKSLSQVLSDKLPAQLFVDQELCIQAKEDTGSDSFAPFGIFGQTLAQCSVLTPDVLHRLSSKDDDSLISVNQSSFRSLIIDILQEIPLLQMFSFQSSTRSLELTYEGEKHLEALSFVGTILGCALKMEINWEEYFTLSWDVEEAIYLNDFSSSFLNMDADVRDRVLAISAGLHPIIPCHLFFKHPKVMRKLLEK